jgi:hypothetical protein
VTIFVTVLAVIVCLCALRSRPVQETKKGLDAAARGKRESRIGKEKTRIMETKKDLMVTGAEHKTISMSYRVRNHLWRRRAVNYDQEKANP